MGNLYNLDIKYFVEVNFDGFKKIVDVMGGVTINVQVPVSDDRFPSVDNRLRRVYIPSGIQHMNGAEALRYARSRHGSNDFDRGARQQRVLLSLREQADPQDLIPRLPAADHRAQVGGLDGHPGQPDRAAARARLAGRHQEHPLVRVLAAALLDRHLPRPARLTSSCPKIGKIRAAVKNAFTTDPAEEDTRQNLAEEGAQVWVLNGTSDNGRGAALAGFLDFHGLAASAPRQRPPGAVPANTTIVVYNGAEAKLADTIAYLEGTFGVKVTLKDDPAIRADVVVTVGKKTPNLEAPPSS